MGRKRYRYKVAVGLDYDRGKDAAPSIALRGEQALADKVVDLAKRFGIPVVEDARLARALSILELEEEIPAELFETVALLLKNLETNEA